MNGFRVLTAASSVSTRMRSSVHDLHAETRAVAGAIEGELDGNGIPQFEAAHGARLQVPVESMRSGNLGYRFGEDLSDAGWIPARCRPRSKLLATAWRRPI